MTRAEAEHYVHTHPARHVRTFAAQGYSSIFAFDGERWFQKKTGWHPCAPAAVPEDIWVSGHTNLLPNASGGAGSPKRG